MRKPNKLPNLSNHNVYGPCATFTVLGKRFLTPLRTVDAIEIPWRIDVAANQLQEFFDEPISLRVPERQARTETVIRVDRVLTADEKCPMVIDKRCNEIWERQVTEDGFRDFLWFIRKTQVKIQNHFDALKVDTSQIDIRRQQATKNWAEIQAFRKSQANLDQQREAEALLYFAENLSQLPRNYASGLNNLLRKVEAFDEVGGYAKISLKRQIQKLIVKLDDIDKTYAEALDIVKAAALLISADKAKA